MEAFMLIEDAEKDIIEPYWGNNLKTQIICKFKYKDGGIATASVSKTEDGNPDWDAIFQKYSIEQIDANTAEKVRHRDEVMLKNQIEDQKRIENMRREGLFLAKTDAFEMDLVRTSKNTALKSKLRKAATPLEVTILATMIAFENYQQQQIPPSDG